jgi:hypothetical protein
MRTTYYWECSRCGSQASLTTSYPRNAAPPVCRCGPLLFPTVMTPVGTNIAAHCDGYRLRIVPETLW